MAFFWNIANRSRVPLSAALVSQMARVMTFCDKPKEVSDSQAVESEGEGGPEKQFREGMQPDADGDYHGIFPKRQLWKPKFEYPLWDTNWDGMEPPLTGDKEMDRKKMREIRRQGVTRHIILVRHGQYDETHKEDEKRILTPLGREQAELTGRRLAEMIAGAENNFGSCKIKVLRVSDMARAKETGTEEVNGLSSPKATLSHSTFPQPTLLLRRFPVFLLVNPIPYSTKDDRAITYLEERLPPKSS
jgi:hypothetical protein